MGHVGVLLLRLPGLCDALVQPTLELLQSLEVAGQIWGQVLRHPDIIAGAHVIGLQLPADGIGDLHVLVHHGHDAIWQVHPLPFPTQEVMYLSV